MKKTTCFILMLVILWACTFNASAADDFSTTSPDWIITEISPDTNGNDSFVGGYNSGEDVFEFIEIYNNSGRVLNLYDYAVLYNGNSHTSTFPFAYQAVAVYKIPNPAGEIIFHLQS